MPRNTSQQDEKTDVVENPEKEITLHDSERWLELSNYDARVQFNMTHLDVLADKLSDAMGLERKERISAKQLLEITYTEIVNQDLGLDSALQFVHLANDQAAIDNAPTQEEAKANFDEIVEKHLNNIHVNRKVGWMFTTTISIGFPLFLATAITGAVMAENGNADGLLLVPGGAMLFGLFIGAGIMVGKTRNLLCKKNDLKDAKANAQKELAKKSDKEKATREELERHFNRSLETATKKGPEGTDERIFVRNDNAHSPYPVRFKRFPMPKA